jgi:hypothetical protein
MEYGQFLLGAAITTFVFLAYQLRVKIKSEATVRSMVDEAERAREKIVDTVNSESIDKLISDSNDELAKRRLLDSGNKTGRD